MGGGERVDEWLYTIYLAGSKQIFSRRGEESYLKKFLTKRLKMCQDGTLEPRGGGEGARDLRCGRMMMKSEAVFSSTIRSLAPQTVGREKINGGA